MSPAPPALRWWGWGDRATVVPPGLAALLHDELGLALTHEPAPPPPAPVLAPSALPAPLLAVLRSIAGDGGVDLSDEGRRRHAAGRSYADLLTLRSGHLAHVPDAVVSPSAVEQVVPVLRACAEVGCAVVPFGGGTSVVGGVTPLRGSHSHVVTLSLRRLNQARLVDRVAMTATLEAGMTLPEAEAALATHGLTLGHTPQSFEYATLGGCAATRSAGQASSGYGRFDEMVLGVRCATAHGELRVAAYPATAAGPSLREVVLGSEGRLAVITELTLRVRRQARRPHYEGWSFPTWRDGVHALRAVAQAGLTPDVLRLSDPEETRVSLAAANRGRTVDRAAALYLRARGHHDGCLLIAGWDSDAPLEAPRRQGLAALLRRHRGISLGSAPGRAWVRSRFEGPYLRDALLDSGVLVETLETAISWTRLRVLHRALVETLHDALTSDGVAPLVGAHISHVYRSGASLYLTVLARPGNDPARRWALAKHRASAAVLAVGGTITHHHGVGTEHRAYLDDEVGERGVAAIRALAAELDPAGIMNPGKLIPG